MLNPILDVLLDPDMCEPDEVKMEEEVLVKSEAEEEEFSSD